MKSDLISLIEGALQHLKQQSLLSEDAEYTVHFERTKKKEHGDFATNIALVLSKQAKCQPRVLAQKIVDNLPDNELVQKTEIAGPGFINIFVNQALQQQVVQEVLSQGDRFGLGGVPKAKKILVEFVSANPTGPLHVGHGRGAAYGDSLARLLCAAGHTVKKEYYVNDAGRQMHILATSLWLRFLQLNKVQLVLPANAYQGEYLQSMAQDLLVEHADQHLIEADRIAQCSLEEDEEKAMDALVRLAQSHLGEASYRLFFQAALNVILSDIKQDLADFGIDFDCWYSEASLAEKDLVTGRSMIDETLECLKQTGHLYQNEGDAAWWFKSSAFGDEKDRVVVRSNGTHTYFASDIAYHLEKFARGFDECIDVLGADHHGYIARLKAALAASDIAPERLRAPMVQFAVLYRAGEKLKMSTRAGKFVTLRALREEVGNDAARFFYVQRKSEQHMDFDLDLAKSKSNENPVYYVQYAHARICSVLREAETRNIAIQQDFDATLLTSEHEERLMTLLASFPEKVQVAARQYEPHQIALYLRELATAFHSYYNQVKFIDAPEPYRSGALALIRAVQQVLVNGLGIIGVSAPEKM